MTRALLLLLLLVPATAGAQPVAGPSFDCARARAWDERMICGDRDLSALDRRVAEAFRQAVDAAPAMVREVQRRARAAGCAAVVRVAEGDLEKLPLKSATQDAASPP